MYVVGIAGGSGSGKSWLAHFVSEHLHHQASILCQDWYYKDNSGLPEKKNLSLNFDHPHALENKLLLKHLDQLIAGQVIQSPCYDYETHARLKKTREIKPAPCIILEGLLVLHEPTLRQRMDVSIFVDTPDDIRLLRRVRRDTSERRVDLEETLRLYEHCVRPMYEKFVKPSAQHATHVWDQARDRKFPGRLLRTLKQQKLFKQSR